MKRSRETIKIGDIIEIPTSRGFVYAQHTHYHKLLGWLLRVLPGFYRDRPDTFSDLLIEKERFYAFFSLEAAVRANLVSVVGNIDIPADFKSFPAMRSHWGFDKETKTWSWWIYNGDKKYLSARLSEDEKKMSIRGVYGFPMLVNMIEEDWRPEISI